MKIIYYSYEYFADCDFPLIGALQKRGFDVSYYVPLSLGFKKSVLFSFQKRVWKMGIVRAADLQEMQAFKDILDLNKLYFIQGYHKYLPHTWLVWFYALYRMKKEKADVIHITWYIKNSFEKFLFHFNLAKLKVLTVHDPFPHSGIANFDKEEKKRIITFNWADRFLILNKSQKRDFSRLYGISTNRVFSSRLGQYEVISNVTPIFPVIDGDYILFFGYIHPYKGLEYLLDAMKIVHKACPNLKLVIAGGGNLYFDLSKYQDDYYVWYNRFIELPELAGFLHRALFSVCPYKDATQSGVVQTSFSMRTPVLATNVGAMAEAIDDNVTGCLVPRCDINKLADKIVFLYTHQDILKQMEKNIDLLLEKNCNWDEICDDYAKVYSI